MRRRTTLASLFAACCLPNLARAQETGWSYDGADGPSHWGQLNGAFRACGDGSQQSPIDLQDPIAARLPPAEVHWRPTPLSIAVGTPITERPPHRTVRAEFPHTAPTLGV